ncbi:hypothetical protein [Enterobacter ludwigii]|jgi:hypothetical protein|nr:hypothetical protein [Enterobacter ludwigii]MBG0576941.1 hypothetical protein [Enterobacter ludwigii]CZX99870.1 Uncharacterised protein [Enterobacter ludwigii]SAH26368.1 Uncharacterised protein [Enterobacter ludwigii]
MLTATITGAACAIKAFQALKSVKLLFHFRGQMDGRHLKDAVLRLES